MDEVALVRRVSREAVGDIEPPALRRHVDDLLSGSSMLPGVLVLLAARSIDSGVDPRLVEDRIAGVQLVYTGLHLTRSLIHEEPWATADDQSGANLDVLAADVLVSRGFYLLARTDAAGRAVEAVRAFGRDQTYRRWDDADVTALDRNLEIDIFELAAISGAGALDERPPKWLRDATLELAFRVDDADAANVRELIAGLGEPLLNQAMFTTPDETISQSATDP